MTFLAPSSVNAFLSTVCAFAKSAALNTIKAAIQRCDFITVLLCGDFGSKVQNHSWIGSVQGAVATWSVISMRDLLTIPDSHRLTRSLPLPVLTRSKLPFPTFEANPGVV